MNPTLRSVAALICAIVHGVGLGACSTEPAPIVPSTAVDTNVVKGRVLGANGEGMRDVVVSIAGDYASRYATTDADGRFTLRAAQGPATLSASNGSDTVRQTLNVGASRGDSITFRLPTWTRDWYDEFEGASINVAEWEPWDFPSQINQELGYYRPDEVSVENGMLRLRTQRRSYGDRQFTSGAAISRSARLYGRFDVHARLPRTRGMWPAHWLVADDSVKPYIEIDIMELLGHDRRRVYFRNHFEVNGALSNRGGHFLGPDFSAGFHTFRVDWFPGEIRWYVDGVERFRSNDGVPDRRMRVIVNTAVGGTWPGNPDATTELPQYHDIDYVRVYAAE